MPHLDLFTVRVMTLITIVMSSLATLFAWRTSGNVDGMRWFAMGLLSMTFGGLIGMAAAVTDGAVLMIASYLVRFAGMIMICQSVRQFRGFPVWRPALLAGFFATVAFLFCWWVFVQDNLPLRTGMISMAMAIVAADGARSMLRDLPPRDRAVFRSLGLVFAFVAVFLMFRGVADMTGPLQSATFSTVPTEIAVTMAGNLAFIGCAYGMLLASNARLRRTAEDSALFDPLTGLPNRRFFEERLVQAEQRAIDNGRLLGVIYLDLDDFKLVNDTRGHDAGDDLLRKVSAAMQRVLRSDDCLARVGGDEFVVLAEGIEHRQRLDKLAERLSAAIESASESGDLPGTRASYGVAIFPEDGASPQDVMREADAGMYKSKRRQRQTAKASARAI